jgi:hexosaminidase
MRSFLMVLAVVASSLLLTGGTAVAAPGAAAQGAGWPVLVNGVPAVVPQPASETAGTGGPFILDTATAIVRTGGDPANAWVAGYLRGLVRPATGLPLPVTRRPASVADAIVLDDSGPGSLGQEGYTLDSDATSVVIRAHTADGLFHGVQTLRQLLPTQVEDRTRQPGISWTVPAVSITDAPRYSYRGVMIDVARHFYSVADIERVIDQAAMYKLNVLHLHLSDDQGWRIAIGAYPDLTAVGASFDGRPGYYTQAQYKAIVAYAAARYITVIPEIDGPAHTTAAATAMATGHDPADIAIDPSAPADNANVQKFLTTVIGEITAMSPGPYFHIGGDESSLPPGQYDHWVTSAASAASADGKTAIGWSQVGAVASLPAGSVLQYWSGKSGNDTGDGLKPGLVNGDKLVLSPDDGAYFDMKYDTSTPLGLTWAGYTPLSKAYDWNPSDVTSGILAANGLTSTITADPTLGVEGALWADTVPPDYTAAQVPTYSDFMLLPRLPALAEITAPLNGSATPRSPAAVTGTGVAGDTVTVLDGGKFAGKTSVGSDGTWSVSLGSGLAHGTHELSAVQSDASDYHSAAADIMVTIGTEPTLADHWAMDETSGTTVADSAGLYPGTLTGSTAFAAGKVGNGLRFDGTVSPVTTGAPDLPAPWTVGVWVDPSAGERSAALLTGASTSVKLQQWDGTGDVGITQKGVTDYVSGYAAPLNTWTYLTLVDDGTTTTVYANGQAVATIGASIALGRADIGTPDAGDPLVGTIDELTVFANALTSGQVAALYTASVVPSMR